MPNRIIDAGHHRGHLDESGSYVKLTVSRSEWDSVHTLEGSDFLFTPEEDIACSAGAEAFFASFAGAGSTTQPGNASAQAPAVPTDVNGDLPATGAATLALAEIAALLCAIGFVMLRTSTPRPTKS